MRRTPEGSRNETLNRNGFRLASIVASGWLDQHQAVDELSAAALESGLPPDEVQTTLASGFAAGLKSPAAPPEDRPPSRTADHEAKKASGGGKPPRFNWREGAISAQALMAKVFPDTVYIVPGILPEGLTLLVGRPKVGKSWWALDLCLAVAGEGYFMGGIVPGIRGDVLYLALEDNQRRLQRRMKKLLGNAEVPERLTFHTRWRRANEGGIDDIREWCDEHPDAKLVVIDTLQTIRPLAGPDGYAKDYQAIEPLQKLAGERSISVVVLHHDRKADADDVFDTISGTLGLSGSSDAMLVLKRDPNVRFVLHGRGRDIEDFEKAMTFEKATCQWRMVGDAEEVKRSAQQRKILAAIGDAKVPVGPKEIATACRMKEDNVKFLLGKLAREGAVEKLDRGLYRLPAHPDQKGGER
jgi:hypothetical protein